MSEESRNDGSIRLLFEMSREDNPPLYDDLVRFSKGSKRVNRLRLLAHEGLRAVALPLRSTVLVTGAGGDAPTPAGADFGTAEVTNPMFGEPIQE